MSIHQGVGLTKSIYSSPMKGEIHLWNMYWPLAGGPPLRQAKREEIPSPYPLSLYSLTGGGMRKMEVDKNVTQRQFVLRVFR